MLVVDDDRANRTLLAELLCDEYRVLLAGNGPAALERLAGPHDVDLVLLDVSMPGMDGHEVLRRLVADERTAHIPVVFITGLGDEEDEEAGLSLGAVDYVTKPVRPAIVRARIRNQLRIVAQRKELERLAARDGLTGIFNRRYFDDALSLACRLAARTGEPLGLAMIDIDDFKAYNDRYGHAAGDRTLRVVAELVAGFARRPYDVAARYGGEEFVLLLPGDVALHGLLEKLRTDVLALDEPHDGSRAGTRLSVSIGGTVARLGERPDEVLARADRMLYRAKRAGRNRVLVADDAVDPPPLDVPVELAEG